MITRKVQANKKWSQLFVTPSALLLLLFSFPTFAETSFSYQGRLSQSGEPANGIYDMRFNLFDAVTAGSLIGPTVNQTGVKVLDGVFNVMLDFGEAPFGSDPRWLRIEVKEAGGGTFVALFPRQRVGASPFAIETLSVAAGAVDTAAIQNGAVTRSKLAADVIGTTQIENNTVTSSDIRDGTITPQDIGPGLYARKTDLYEVRSEAISVGSFYRTRPVECNDANDLVVWAACDALDDSTGLVFNSTHENWNSDTAAAKMVCTAHNLTPASAASYEAVMWCIDVPGE